MNALIVSMVAFDSNTSATIQNRGIVKGLVALGWDVDTLTPRPLVDSLGFDKTMNDIDKLIVNSFHFEPSKGYKVLAAKKAHDRPHRISFRGFVKEIILWARPGIKKIYDAVSIFDAQKTGVKNIDGMAVDYQRYDVIISASDPKSSHLIVKRILKNDPQLKAKWIQYWGDPMYHDITRKRDWRDWLVHLHEKRLISAADRVIYASPLTLELQTNTFSQYATKMDYANQVYVEHDRCSGKGNGDFSEMKIGYFGAYHSSIRDIMPTYNTARRNGFDLTICGSSDLALEATESVKILGNVPYGRSIALERDSDILLCLCNSLGTQIPGKIYYYTAYQKPIVVVLDGEHRDGLRDYLRSFGRFILCDNDEEAIRDAIEEAKSQVGCCFNVIEKLTPKFLARKILGDFHGITGTR